MAPGVSSIVSLVYHTAQPVHRGCGRDLLTSVLFCQGRKGSLEVALTHEQGMSQFKVASIDACIAYGIFHFMPDLLMPDLVLVLVVAPSLAACQAGCCATRIATPSWSPSTLWLHCVLPLLWASSSEMQVRQD
jgi:hypothetical protein